MPSRQIRRIRKHGLPPESLVYTGQRSKAPAQLHTILYNESGFSEFSELLPPKPGSVLWLDIRNLGDTDTIARAGAAFQIHPLALEDVLNTRQRAKLEEFDNGLFFIVHRLSLNTETMELVSEQIAIFSGIGLVVSFQENPDDTFAVLRKRIADNVGRIRKKGADYLTYSILDTIIDGYYEVLDQFENEMMNLEETLHTTGARNHEKARIFRLKRLVNDFKHRVLPLREAVGKFYRSDGTFVEESNRLYIRDLVDHVAQILDNLDSERDMLSNMEAYYQAEAANKLNNVMRLLTVISTIFIPLSFIAGIYGMNFENMPELRTRNGYFILLGVMASLMLSMLAIFKSRKWI
ncbi:MAG: magnesium/cobalt transporter CorA [Bacteroidota bacterium]